MHIFKSGPERSQGGYWPLDDCGYDMIYRIEAKPRLHKGNIEVPDTVLE